MGAQEGPNVAELARRCAEEMARYQREGQYDPAHCYELFRCALVQRREDAWAAIYEQYHGLVYFWLGHTPGESEVLVNHVFDRFWSFLTPDRFADFASMKSILGYLKRCALGIAIDARRKEERRKVRDATLIEAQRIAAGRSSDLSQVLDRIAGEQLYARATQRLQDEQEKLVFYASFELGLKPSQIAKRWETLFDDAQHVSRIKERILRRLRRDKGVGELMGVADVDGGKAA